MMINLALLFAVWVVVCGHPLHIRSARAIIASYTAFRLPTLSAVTQPINLRRCLQGLSYCVQTACAHYDEYDEEFEQLATPRLEFLAAGDPTCANGIKASHFCCAKSCGKCGGKVCQKRPGGGSKCCFGKISAAGKNCDSVSAPCLIKLRARSFCDCPSGYWTYGAPTCGLCFNSKDFCYTDPAAKTRHGVAKLKMARCTGSSAFNTTYNKPPFAAVDANHDGRISRDE